MDISHNLIEFLPLGDGALLPAASMVESVQSLQASQKFGPFPN